MAYCFDVSVFEGRVDLCVRVSEMIPVFIPLADPAVETEYAFEPAYPVPALENYISVALLERLFENLAGDVVVLAVKPHFLF